MKRCPCICAMVLAAEALSAQSRLQLANAEDAFPDPAKLNHLDCALSRKRPTMGIDLRFHTGFSVTVPLKKLAGGGGAIRTLLRVTPAAAPERTAYFSMVTPTPAVEPGEKGGVELRGDFAVGPGRYAVDWRMSFGDAVCRDRWELEAKLNRPFSQLPLAIGANTAGELPPDPFDEPGRNVPRAPHSLHLKLLVNFAPAGIDNTILDTEDVRVVTSILRAVSRDPDFGRFSVVAFSSDQERVLDRQPAGPKIDFHTLGRAVRELRSGVVSIRQMQDPRSTTRFLETLLAEELGLGEPSPDAVILISPKLSLDEKLSERELAERARVECPVFLLSYNPHPVADPWQGVLARAVKKAYKGLEYSITGPRDLGNALLRLKSELPGAARWASPSRSR